MLFNYSKNKKILKMFMFDQKDQSGDHSIFFFQDKIYCVLV